MIHVTKTFLPPIEEYIEYMKGIWERNQLTNNDPLLRTLEEKLQEYLGVKNLLVVNNGTIALQIAIKALDLKGGPSQHHFPMWRQHPVLFGRDINLCLLTLIRLLFVLTRI